MADIRLKVMADLAAFQELIDHFNGSMEELADLLMDRAEAHEEAKKSAIAEKDAIDAAVQSMERAARTAPKGLYQEVNELSNAYGELRKNIIAAGNAQGEHGGVSQLLEASLPKASTGMVSAVGQFKQTLLAELPFGGLLGLMLLGGKQDEEVRAVSSQVARSFQQTGDVGRSTLQGLTGEIRELSRYMGKGPTGMFEEFGRAAQEFARQGLDMGDVMKRGILEPVTMTKGSILETAVAMDSLFRQGAGTTARQMGVMIKDFNMGTAESQKLLLEIGFAARDSGQSVEQFTGSVMRSAAALRTQRVDISEVAEAQLHLIDAMKMQMPDMNQQFAAGYAQRGIEQVSRGIAGLSVGMSAILGERISNRVASEPGASGAKMGRMEGLDAYYALREGFTGFGQNNKESGTFNQTILELGRLVKEQGGSYNEQRYMLEKLVPGVGAEGSRAILAIADEIGKSNDPDKLGRAVATHQDELKRAFTDRGAETNSLLRAANELQQGMAQIGAALLQVTISGFRSIQAAFGMMTNLPGTQDYKDYQKLFDEQRSQADRAVSRFKQGWENIGAGAKWGENTLMLGRGIDDVRNERIMKGPHATLPTTWGGQTYIAKEDEASYKSLAANIASEQILGRTREMLKERQHLNTQQIDAIMQGWSKPGSHESQVDSVLQAASAMEKKLGRKLGVRQMLHDANDEAMSGAVDVNGQTVSIKAFLKWEIVDVKPKVQLKVTR